MKLIYTKDGFSKQEKEEWRVIIFNNILDSLRLIVDAMEEFGVNFAYDNTTVCATFLTSAFVLGDHGLTFVLPGTSSYTYARERPATFRTDPNRVSARIQGLMEG